MKNYLFVISPFKALDDSSRDKMESLGRVIVLEKEGDFRDQLEAELDVGNYSDVEVLVSHSGDGGSLKVAEIAQKHNLHFMSLPAGTGNDIPIAFFDDQIQYKKISRKEAHNLHHQTLDLIETDNIKERHMDALSYTAHEKNDETLSGYSYIGHHLHLVAKAGQMDGIWGRIKKIGPLSYVLRGAASILQQSPTDFKVELEGELEELSRDMGEPKWNYIGQAHELDASVWGGQILNTETTGGGKLKIEGESAYDGKFSFMYIGSDEVSKRRLFGLSSKLNNSIYLDGVSAIRGIKKMKIKSEGGFDFGVDGETYGDLVSGYASDLNKSKIHELEVEIEPGVLKVYVPLLP